MESEKRLGLRCNYPFLVIWPSLYCQHFFFRDWGEVVRGLFNEEKTK